ncbi:histidine ammonia-lyase [Mammaliicoccus sciuri]|uniref:histidine ammonia-lyase n=1 Tax=Mammaliicoccus sciuri TaxID=1296 RepID=UPI001FB2B21D|nr:histidine ammonia-lyase [Mammaliicoccus sciuri]MCJ0922503.1 histidine ammonia-lyase [Mammaliicoccus sciuri]MCJ0926007.1 histidine ammonia-lyase [Mammaliicoccus sciuri]MCJ1761324.1 histidine ammonia-lyase [Mammaliicoccus sciuri]MDO0952429.1 histidine ammonia-lyase [Mammaliicoccus sciuri]MEB6118541.1 histidine ammonia-lyase [Mammaliicoccus sciuri]
MNLVLNGKDLTIQDIKQFLKEDGQISISEEALVNVRKSRETVEKIIKNKETIYGITTGFGLFSDVLIEQEKYNDLQVNLIRSHSCGTGKPFPDNVSLIMMVLRLNTMLKGHSGVTEKLVSLLVEFINRRIIPVIPEQGSLGASGDLAPLSHLALALIGEGDVRYKGETRNAKEVLHEVGLEPHSLQAKEGLALINGTQAMTSQGVIAYIEAENIAHHAEWIAALTHQALNGIVDAYDEHVHIVRNFNEQVEVAERMRNWLEGSKLTTRQGEVRVQDAYTLRCIPQIHGASLQVLNYVKEKLELEMNAANDNPLIFDNDDETLVISGGNFHGQPIAFAVDFLKIGVAELANVSERRLERLVNPQLNGGLPAFLSPEPGLQSGAMIMQYAAASLVSENKTLAHPASVDSIPSSANQEDHVSMGTIGARHAYQIIQNVRRVISIECIIALQAVEIKGVDKLSPKTKVKYEELRSIVPSITQDRVFHHDIEKVCEYLR